MPKRGEPEPPPARRPWGRYRLAAVIGIGIVAVLLIANTHPWTYVAPPPPSFQLKTLTVTFTGSGSGAVHSGDLCLGHCPLSAAVGSSASVAFLVEPNTAITGNCDPSPHFTITKVAENPSSAAFALTAVSANNGEKLPVTIPDPLGGTTCVDTDQIWVTFSVADQGPSSQTPALQVTVTES